LTQEQEKAKVKKQLYTGLSPVYTQTLGELTDEEKKFLKTTSRETLRAQGFKTRVDHVWRMPKDPYPGGYATELYYMGNVLQRASLKNYLYSLRVEVEPTKPVEFTTQSGKRVSLKVGHKILFRVDTVYGVYGTHWAQTASYDCCIGNPHDLVATDLHTIVVKGMSRLIEMALHGDGQAIETLGLGNKLYSSYDYEQDYYYEDDYDDEGDDLL
jgi:hypothetical protein